MINPKKLYNFLKNKNINFFTGVPDSILKNFTSSIPNNKNFIVANEGSGIALATGHYLKKKKIPCVYMQKFWSGECCKSFGLISAQESLLNTYGFANWLEGKTWH